MYRKFKIAIVGNGSASKYLQDYLVNFDTSYGDVDVDIFSRTECNEYKMRNIASLLNSRRVCKVNFNFVKIDLDDTRDFLKFIEYIRDDNYNIVVNLTRAISHLKYGSMSFDKGIGYGVWLPLALRYSYKIAEALQSGKCKKTLYVNSSYPDATVPIIQKFAYKNTVGIGNASHIIPRLANYYNVKSRNINIVGGHYLDIMFCGGKPMNCDYVAGIYTDSSTKLKPVDLAEIQESCNRPFLDMPKGAVRNLAIAEDAYTVIDVVANLSSIIIHLVGIDGLTGSVPCYFRSGDRFTRSSSIGMIPQEEIERVCSDNLKADGVELVKVGESGFDVLFDLTSLELLHKYYGYEYSNNKFELRYGDDVINLISLGRDLERCIRTATR